MNIFTISRKFGLVLTAGILALSLVAPMTALASEGGDDYYGGDAIGGGTTDYYGGDYASGATDYYGGDYASGATDYYGGDYANSATDYYGGDYAQPDYSTPAYSAPTFGGSSGSGFSMPSFGGSTGGSSYPVFTSSANQAYRQTIIPTLPQYAQAQASSCSAVNTCNSTYTDNSVYAPDNSYTMTDNSVYSAPTTVTVTAPTTVTTDSHNQQIAYAPAPEQKSTNTHDYSYPTFQQQYQYQAQYQQPTYQQPVAYNTTPYITLSQAPYTGLDLGPWGEVLYWTFLVLWCLGAAYLVVVKRVQNKLVSFLNGFLFGTSAKTTVAHATHAPQARTVASAPLVEEGIDSFIQAQIKRA